MKYLLVSALLTYSICSAAQTNSKGTSLQEIIQQAEANFPILKAKQFSVNAAVKAVAVSNHTKLPSLDAAYQLNYATYNNITGMAAPQFFVPISGPPSTSNIYNGVFGTVAGLLFNWQPITFGQREAQVAYSQAGVVYARADAANEILQHKIKVVNAYLDAITIIELEKVYSANLVRTEANLSIAKTLVMTGIKPGVDTALFSSEISKAKIDWLNIQKNKEQAIIELAQLVNTTDSIRISDTSYFSKLPANTQLKDSSKHPLLSLYNASVELDKAKRKSISKTTSPTLGVWGTTYARGSGIKYDGTVKVTDGLGLQRFNYGVGVQLSVPLLQSAKIKPLLQQQDFLIKANEEKLNEVELQLNKQMQTAESAFKYAMAIVAESPVLVQSSLYAYKAIVSRYNAGLTNYTDVVQAQYNLLKAETDNKSSYIAVWKAMLYKAAVAGDLNLFLALVK